MLLKTSTSIGKHPVTKLASEVSQGDHLKLVVHVKGMYWSYLEGTVAAIRPTFKYMPTKGPFIQVTSALNQGGSGGAAFNENGEMVGIASFVSTSAPGVGFLIHIDTVKNFLHAQRIIK
jgi:serine protease Do